MKKKHHVFGAFRTVRGASAAVEQLTENGIDRKTISAVMSDTARGRLATVETHTKGAEGALVGGIAGGLLGGLVTTIGAVMVPGVAALAFGPIVAALAGAGAGSATGSTLGVVLGLGMTERQLALYTDILKGDGVLVVVSTSDRRMRDLARKTFDEMGALNVETRRGTTAVVQQTPAN